MPRELPRPSAPSLLEVLPWGDPAADRRRLLRAAGAALFVHAVLFLVVWPGGPLAAPPEILEAPRFVVHSLRPRAPEPAFPEAVTPAPPVEAPTVVIPAPPQEPPEPTVRPIEIVRPPETPVALLDPGFEIPALGPPPPPGPQPFDARVMEAPLRLHAPLPAYTEPARRARREGDVVVEAVIDLEGRVREARILESLGFGLDESALRALADWRFEPARKGGRAIPVLYRLVVRFRLS
jgi:protein TonB